MGQNADAPQPGRHVSFAEIRTSGGIPSDVNAASPAPQLNPLLSAYQPKLYSEFLVPEPSNQGHASLEVAAAAEMQRAAWMVVLAEAVREATAKAAMAEAEATMGSCSEKPIKRAALFML